MYKVYEPKHNADDPDVEKDMFNLHISIYDLEKEERDSIKEVINALIRM